MIQATDLMIGNLVNAALYPNAIIVESICSSNEDIYNRDTGEIALVAVSPIQINSDWFIKFGFDFSGDVLFKDLFEVAMTKNNKFYLRGIIFGVVEIKYVHQLQNIYYCLTAEKLECSI